VSSDRPDAAPPRDRFLGIGITPLTRRRLHNFRANKRGFWSLWIFILLFGTTLFAELIANDRPILVYYDGNLFTPVFTSYPETAFGGEFELEADYRDPFVRDLIDEKGWILWPLVRYDYRTVAWDLPVPAPSPPDAEHWLGTDDQARDVVARMIYGARISVLFGFILTVFSTIVGVAAGAVQGYFGGWTDLLFQRFIEIWSGLPTLFLLIILASVVEPNFWWLLGIMLLFSWMSLVGVVRAEFLRARNFDYVRAARLRLRAGGPGPGRFQFHYHVPPCPAECLGGDGHLPAVHSLRLGHHLDGPGLSRIRPAARLGFPGRTAGPRQVEPAGALAGAHRLFRDRRHAEPLALRR
jgi:microcin C transport system permease protein